MVRVKPAKSLSLVMLMTASLSCSVAVKTVPTPVALPARFSASGTADTAEKWWQSFNDSALNQLCEQALDQNFSLRTAFERLEQARAVANRIGAGLIPELNIGVTGTQALGDQSAETASALDLLASYELDLWGRIRAARNAAELDAKATREDVVSAAISLTAEISSVWYQLIEQRRQLQLLDQQIKVNHSNVILVTARFRGGQATAADVFQQNQLLESVIGSRLTVVAAIKVLENQLAILTGKAPGTVKFSEQNQFPDLPPLPETGLSAELMKRRPDVRRAYLSVQAADQRIASAVAERLPKLSLTAGIGTSSLDLQPLFNNWIATIAGNLLTPLVDGGFRVAEVERNRAVAAEAMNDYASVLLNAVKEVEDALIQERQQQQLVVNLGKQLQLSQQASEQIRSRYVNGAMDFLRVLTALLSQQSLERSLIQAERQLLDYRIALYRALSGGFSVTKPSA